MIFITGCNGFVGQNLINKLSAQGEKVIGIDPIEQRHYNKANSFKFLKASTLDKGLLLELFKEHKPSTIIHMGMVSTPKDALQNPELAKKSILEGSLNLMELALEFNAEKFIHFSSSHVYGDINKQSISEEETPQPKSLYGKIKWDTEQRLRKLSHSTNLRTHIIRPTSVYGPNDPGMRVVSLFIERAIKNQPLIIKDSLSRLDFTYIEDLLEGVQLLLSTELDDGITINLSRGEGRSLIDLAKVIQTHLPETIYEDQSVEDSKKTVKGCLDIGRAKRLLGYEPKVDLEAGIKKILETQSKQWP